MAINWSKLAEGALGGLFNLGTSMIGGSIMSNISNRQLRQNMAYQNNWQAQQAEIARDWQADQAVQQNEWSEKMNAQQQEWQEGMWNKTNEWNSETSRMQRLLDSGINPNNAAGLISGNQTAAQLAQQPQIPSANPYPSTSIPNGGSMQGASLIDGVNAMTNAKMQAAQARLTNAQADNQEINNGYQAQINETQINYVKAQTDKEISLKDLNETQKERIEKFENVLTEAVTNKTRGEAFEILSNIQIKLQQALTYVAQRAEILQNIAKLKQDIKESQSREALNKAEAALKVAQKQLIDLQKQGQIIANGIEGLRFNQFKNTGRDPNHPDAVNAGLTLFEQLTGLNLNNITEGDGDSGVLNAIINYTQGLERGFKTLFGISDDDDTPQGDKPQDSSKGQSGQFSSSSSDYNP